MTNIFKKLDRTLENFNREIEIIKKYQIKFLELKIQ